MKQGHGIIYIEKPLMQGKSNLFSEKSEKNHLKKCLFACKVIASTQRKIPIMSKKRTKKVEKTEGHTIRAKFAAANGGFGFAIPLDAEKYKQDIFIPPAYTANAIDGDIVQIRLRQERNGKRFPDENRGPVGEIVDVIEHGRKNVVAQLTGKRSASPMDKHLPEEITVNTLPKGAKAGDWVKLTLLNTGKKRTKHLYAEGTERIGQSGTVAADLKAIAAEFDLQDNAYTEKQNSAAGKLEPLEIKRVRLTKPWTITIDPADAHDFDDAISLAPGKTKDEVLLGVHIADVAAYIQPGSTFDKEAAKRCFSAYIPGMFLPMLPKALTQKMSLREGVDSPAHTILFTVEKKSGKIKKAERFHSVVRIKKRLDYGTVQAFLDDPASAPADWTTTFKRNLKQLANTVQAIRAERQKREQFLDMPLPEIRVLCDEKTKRVTGIQRKEPCEADALVEECMLAANTAVAGELIAKQTPGLYRIHPEPDPAKIEQFSSICTDSFHFNPGDILSSRTACQHFLASIPEGTKKPVILSLFLRSLPRASYQAEPGLHYGLGKEKYAHFTSPIRRYPDLLVHQQLWGLDCNKALKSKKKLAELAEICSLKEENVDNAFFAANDRLKLHFLQENGAMENGTMFEAVISRVTAAGIVCSIDELGLYGFIPRERLRGGDYRRSSVRRQKMLSGSGHNSYKTGDFIYVALDAIDPVHGTVTFRPAI